MHQIELDAAVVTTQFGLYTGFGSFSTWVHDGDALRSLRTPELAAKLNAALDADPQYWQKLIKKWFLDNKHRLTITARTDADYDKKLDDAEKKKLKGIEKRLTEEQKAKIVADDSFSRRTKIKGRRIRPPHPRRLGSGAKGNQTLGLEEHEDCR